MLNIDESTGEIIKPNNDYVHSYKDEFNNICIDCDLPGRDKDNIHIYWYGSKNLAIIADERAAGKYDYYSRESIHVTFHFQNDMDYDNSTATYNNGVLTVSTKPLNK